MSGLILIVEDERDLSETLEYALSREGFVTRTAQEGRRALEMVGEGVTPDLVLLDLMLPDMSGIEVCRQLRAEARTKTIPIIMTSAKGDEIDRVVGFEIGADDYVVKPFSVRELVLRCRAVIRRRQVVPEARALPQYGILRIDRDAYRVWVGEDEIRLTALEFRLLTTLIDRRGRVQSRESLLADAWEGESGLTSRTVDTHIKRLRDKLGEAGAYVQTARGFGYRFSVEPGG